ncbi:PAS domain-containing protein, partial [Myxococcota bacterium]|nr:PAS domain-containing protein [Myxococcota bacterium]
MSHAFIDSEWSYRELLEGIGVGVLVAEVRTRRFLYANPAVCKLLGYTAAELTNLSVSELHPPGELPRIIQDFEAQSRGEQLLAADAPCLRKDGSIVYCDISSSTKTIGSVDCLVGVFFDITARKQAEEALRESETRLQALSDNLPGGLVYQIDTGLDGASRRFTYVSAGVESMHGVTASEVLQDPMKIYGQIPEEDQAEVAQAEAAAIASMTPFSAEVRIHMPDGTIRWRLFCSAPRRFANGHLIWDGIEVDINSRKR